MSDDQIRDLFQKAEEWSPDKNAPATSDGSTVSAPTASPPVPVSAGAGPTLPQLQLGSDVEIADAVAQVLRQERGEVIFS
jgi:hypothetical protein